MKIISFYDTKGEYGYFSNFAVYPITIKGKLWNSSEHYFQAQKFAGLIKEELIRIETSPIKCAELGRDRNNPLRDDWELIKTDVMRDAVLAKFTQHIGLMASLKNTKDCLIVEHTDKDSFWADGGDGSGLNMLGRIIMEIRDKILNNDYRLIAQKKSWHTVVLPQEIMHIPIQRDLSYYEFRQIIYGYIPKDMNDEWFIYFEDCWLSIHRSWTGYCVYKMRIEESGSNICIRELIVNKNTDQYDSKAAEHEVQTAFGILDNYLFKQQL